MFIILYASLTSCAGTTCHARREFFAPIFCNISSVLSIFKCNPCNKWQVYYFLNNFYPVIATSSKGKASDDLSYTVMVREPVASARGSKVELEFHIPCYINSHSVTLKFDFRTTEITSRQTSRKWNPFNLPSAVLLLKTSLSQSVTAVSPMQIQACDAVRNQSIHFNQKPLTEANFQKKKKKKKKKRISQRTNAENARNTLVPRRKARSRVLSRSHRTPVHLTKFFFFFFLFPSLRRT